MRSVIFVLIIALSTTLIAGAADKDQNALRDFEGKQFTLREPYSANKLIFSSEGNCEGKCELGGWAHNGVLVVRKVQAAEGTLIISGDRFTTYYDAGGKPQGIHGGDIKIRIKLPGPANDQAIRQAIEHVFIGPRDLTPNGPPPPLPQVTDNFEMKFDGSRRLIRMKNSQEWKPLAELAEPVEVGILPTGEKIYTVTRALTLPKPLNLMSPGPSFSKLELYSRPKGKVLTRAVIDATGHVQAIRVLTSPYSATVKATVIALAQSEFSPATLNGRPVACDVLFNFDMGLY